MEINNQTAAIETTWQPGKMLTVCSVKKNRDTVFGDHEDNVPKLICTEKRDWKKFPNVRTGVPLIV